MLKTGFFIHAGIFVLVSVLCTSAAGSSFNLDFTDFFRHPENEIQNGLEKIRLIHYLRSPRKEIMHRKFSLGDTEELMSGIDLKKPYVLYIHGYLEHPSNESVRTIVSAYLEKGKDNIIVLDWSPIAFDNYLIVSLRMKDIARVAAKAITKLVRAGLNVNTLHVIGHSMGAQVAGFMGQYLDFTVPRVTGLDPASPLFYQFGAEHITRKSGQQVDIIHSDGGFYGAFPVTGTVDFYPNGGVRPQPGCHLFGIPLSPTALCSHWRSWRIYAESVVDEKAFPALKCNSYEAFTQGRCKRNKVIYCGYALPKDVTGTYYFTTNYKSPFGRGMSGIKSN